MLSLSFLSSSPVSLPLLSYSPSLFLMFFFPLHSGFPSFSCHNLSIPFLSGSPFSFHALTPSTLWLSVPPLSGSPSAPSQVLTLTSLMPSTPSHAFPPSTLRIPLPVLLSSPPLPSGSPFLLSQALPPFPLRLSFPPLSNSPSSLSKLSFPSLLNSSSLSSQVLPSPFSGSAFVSSNALPPFPFRHSVTHLSDSR